MELGIVGGQPEHFELVLLTVVTDVPGLVDRGIVQQESSGPCDLGPQLLEEGEHVFSPDALVSLKVVYPSQIPRHGTYYSDGWLTVAKRLGPQILVHCGPGLLDYLPLMEDALVDTDDRAGTGP